jgi:hypothetical protein
VAILSGACGPASAPTAPSAVAQRAAFDLACPIEQLQLVPLKTTQPRSYGVLGCQKRVAYVEICSIAMYGLLTNSSCSWTLDGPIQSTAPAPAHPAPPVLPAAASAPPPAPQAAPASSEPAPSPISSAVPF